VLIDAGLKVGGLISLFAISGGIDPALAVWSTAITVGGSVLLQILKDRREQQRYREDREDRREVARLARESSAAILTQGRNAARRLADPNAPCSAIRAEDPLPPLETPDS
jgi:hypothetical protein